MIQPVPLVRIIRADASAPTEQTARNGGAGGPRATENRGATVAEAAPEDGRPHAPRGDNPSMLRQLVFGSLAALAVLTIPSFAQEKSAAAPAAGKKACATCEAKTTVAAAIRCEKCAKEAAPCAACQERATLVKSLPDPTCAAQKVLDSCPKCKEMGKFCCGGCEGKATA